MTAIENIIHIDRPRPEHLNSVVYMERELRTLYRHLGTCPYEKYKFYYEQLPVLSQMQQR